MTASRAVERDDEAQAPLLPLAGDPARGRTRRVPGYRGRGDRHRLRAAALAVQLSRSVRVDRWTGSAR
jgi:hypothetical protein